MLPIILLYALAGGLLVGGSAGGKMLFDEAETKRQLRKDIKKLKDIEMLLEANMSLAQVKDLAKQQGIDVEKVEAGYAAFQSGRISAIELAKILEV